MLGVGPHCRLPLLPLRDPLWADSHLAAAAYPLSLCACWPAALPGL